MPAFDTAKTRIFRRPRCDWEASISISRGNARQDPTGHRSLYILGFGITGAIFANALVFVYFMSFYTSG